MPSNSSSWRHTHPWATFFSKIETPFLFIFFILPWWITTVQAVHHSSSPTFCEQTTECVMKVRRMALEADRFWFGFQWKLNCLHGAGGGGGRGRQKTSATTAATSLECMNPRELTQFHTLGSRLFRVQTFTEDYLADLKVFPRIKFSLHSGAYRACDHDFLVERVVGNDEPVEVHPESPPLKPFQALHIPEIGWPELRSNDSLIVVMLDAGFGVLKFLATDFPRNTQISLDYSPIDNVRAKQPTPLVVLVFQPPKGFSGDRLRWLQQQQQHQKASGDQQLQQKPFDLSSFIMENGLEGGLIGLNWALIGADAFAIERQRVKGGGVDNCHSLVQSKLLQDRRWAFVEKFPLGEMDASLSVSVVRPEIDTHVCCTAFSMEEETFLADPLGDMQLPSSALRHKPPQVLSLRPFDQLDSYQRTSRHYVALREDRFSLVLFDPAKSYLYWLVADIPAETLVTGGALEGDGIGTVAEYLPPIPDNPGECLFTVFMLFRQPNKMKLLEELYNAEKSLKAKSCVGHCKERSRFDIERFKSLHRLQLSAVSWARVCFDVDEAVYRIGLMRQQLNENDEDIGDTSPAAGNTPILRAHPRIQSSELDEAFSRNPWLLQQTPNPALESKQTHRKRLIQELCERFELGPSAGGDCECGASLTASSSIGRKLWSLRKVLAISAGITVVLLALICFCCLRIRRLSRKFYHVR